MTVSGYALAGHFDGVRVSQLMGREASPDAGRTAPARAEVRRAADADQGRPAVGP